jgi:hypothetical protein
MSGSAGRLSQDETTMTELLSRPRTGTDASEPSPRPLPVAGAVAGATAVGVTLVICMAVAVIGWFLADAGAHGDTTDALRIGADAWLLGHGGHLTVAGTPVGITPLGLTAVLLVGAFRAGRWAADGAAPADDDRTLGVATAVCTGVYVVLAVVLAEVAGRGAAVSLPRTVLGAVLVAGCAGGLGLATGSGRLAAWWDEAPGYLRSITEGALAGAGFAVAASALVVAVALAMSFNDAASVFSSLRLSFGDGLMLLLVSALVAPNAVLLGLSWLAGPGFAVGTGTSVTVSAATLGPVPAFPLLAALPGDGGQPGWMVVLLGLPPLAAAVGAGLAQRRYAVTAWDSAALRGFGSGLGAGVACWLLVSMAGGPMGTDRLADIGASSGGVLVTAVGGMSLGGLLGGLVVALLQRRSPRTVVVDARASDAGPQPQTPGALRLRGSAAAGPEAGDEETVQLDRGNDQ